jgi:predicted AlkP superfamily phosphohydrolase/phosphomutase
MNEKINLLVIGIDGACWPLINNIIDSGKLPNLKSLMENGVWGDMKSCIPPITCPAWKCYSTGKNPGKLGVFWWEYLDIKNKRSIIPDSRSFDSKEVWDYLNDNGLKTGIIGMPTTFPPKKVNGFMISGAPGAQSSGYAYPNKIEKDLQEKFKYDPNPNIFSVLSPTETENREKIIDESLKHIESNFIIGEYLYEKEKPDFLQVCTFTINGPLQHFFYNDEPTIKAWEIVDKYLGRFKEKFDYIVIHSDHGTSPMIKQFFINAWLKKEGYLVHKKNIGDLFSKMGIHKINKIIEKLNMSDFLWNFNLTKSITRLVPDEHGLFGETEGAAIFQNVDWDKTKVVGSAQGPLYINSSIMSEEEKKRLEDELISKLESFTDPETGKKPIEKVYRAEEIYIGKYAKKGPDLVALDSDEYHNKGGIGVDKLFSESLWKGNNARNGLYLISGEGIKKGKRIDIDIYDLAPTILHIFDMPIPIDMDGKVIKDAFEGKLFSRKINFHDDKTQTEKSLIRDIIKKRGIRDDNR